MPDRDRAAWALAFYAGLRLGELRALDWADVDLDAGEITITKAWCNKTKQVTAPKTEAAVRTIPIVGELRRILLEHKLVMGRIGGLVVQREGGGVESGDSLAWRSEQAWKAAGLERVTMHEARHTYASLMIVAAVPITALSKFMGHTSITITVDRYGHLYPSERQAAVDAFDACSSSLKTLAQFEIGKGFVTWRGLTGGWTGGYTPQTRTPSQTHTVSKTVGRGFESFHPCSVTKPFPTPGAAPPSCGRFRDCPWLCVARCICGQLCGQRSLRAGLVGYPR